MMFAGQPIYIALERIDLRMRSERLSGWVREHMAMEPRSRVQFVFVGAYDLKRADCSVAVGSGIASGDIAAFNDGRVAAYREVLSFMKTQAEVFQLPLEELGLSDWDPLIDDLRAKS